MARPGIGDNGERSIEPIISLNLKLTSGEGLVDFSAFLLRMVILHPRSDRWMVVSKCEPYPLENFDDALLHCLMAGVLWDCDRERKVSCHGKEGSAASSIRIYKRGVELFGLIKITLPAAWAHFLPVQIPGEVSIHRLKYENTGH